MLLCPDIIFLPISSSKRFKLLLFPLRYLIHLQFYVAFFFYVAHSLVLVSFLSNISSRHNLMRQSPLMKGSLSRLSILTCLSGPISVALHCDPYGQYFLILNLQKVSWLFFVLFSFHMNFQISL